MADAVEGGDDFFDEELRQPGAGFGIAEAIADRWSGSRRRRTDIERLLMRASAALRGRSGLRGYRYLSMSRFAQ